MNQSECTECKHRGSDVLPTIVMNLDVLHRRRLLCEDCRNLYKQTLVLNGHPKVYMSVYVREM